MAQRDVSMESTYIGSVISSSGIIICKMQQRRRLTRCNKPEIQDYPAGTIRWSHVDPMLGQRRRRWANIRSAWGQRIVPAG